jgi:hypothetical protein
LERVALGSTQVLKSGSKQEKENIYRIVVQEEEQKSEKKQKFE